MFLHTTQPVEMVFPQKEFSTEFMWVEGSLLECYTVDKKKYVSRLISTNPKLFLKKEFMPGSELRN